MLEGLRLRVQDVDFEMKQITVRDGKGAKDRYTPLAEALIPALREHLERVRLMHQEDLKEGYLVKRCEKRRTGKQRFAIPR